MTPYVLTVDIGNTNTHIGLIKCASRSILSLDVFPTKDIPTCLTNTIWSAVKTVPDAPVVICSVVQSIEEQYHHKLSSSIQSQVLWLHYNEKLPLTIPYKNPALLGADRIADLVYAHGVFPGENVIVVDAGTTITIDYLHKGSVFRGGAIMPGPSTQLKSLRANTDQLPELELDSPDTEFPGMSTAACIHAGVLFGTAGAVSHIVDRYRHMYNEPSRIVATGGAWPFLKPYVTFEASHIPEMTMAGCALYFTLLNS